MVWLRGSWPSQLEKLKNDDTTLVTHVGSIVVQSSFALIQSISQSVNQLFIRLSENEKKHGSMQKNSTLSDEFIHGRRNRRCKGDIVHLPPSLLGPGRYGGTMKMIFLVINLRLCEIFSLIDRQRILNKRNFFDPRNL